MSDKRPPTVIYLPSSGGYTGSRIVSESEDRRRFPFRRYSVDENGGLVVRTRNISRDNRTRPYTRHTVRFSTPVSRSGSLSISSEAELPQSPSTSKQDDTADLLRTLVPALIRDPATYEDSISSICTAYNIDPSVVSAIKYAAKRGSSSRPLDRQRTLDPPATSSHNPIPTSSTAPVISGSLTPHRHERTFSSGPRGTTIWYTTESHTDVLAPPAVPAVAGHIYVHTNMTTTVRQMWLYDASARWIVVTDQMKVAHPTLSDRVLSIRSDGTPNWVTPAGFVSTQHRRGRAKSRP